MKWFVCLTEDNDVVIRTDKTLTVEEGLKFKCFIPCQSLEKQVRLARKLIGRKKVICSR